MTKRSFAGNSLNLFESFIVFNASSYFRRKIAKVKKLPRPIQATGRSGTWILEKDRAEYVLNQVRPLHRIVTPHQDVLQRTKDMLSDVLATPDHTETKSYLEKVYKYIGQNSVVSSLLKNVSSCTM